MYGKRTSKSRELNADESKRERELEQAGFKATPVWDGAEWCFDTVTPNGVEIGPMTAAEAFWMMRGYKAGLKNDTSKRCSTRAVAQR